MKYFFLSVDIASFNQNTRSLIKTKLHVDAIQLFPYVRAASTRREGYREMSVCLKQTKSPFAHGQTNLTVNQTNVRLIRSTTKVINLTFHLCWYKICSHIQARISFDSTEFQMGFPV